MKSAPWIPIVLSSCLVGCGSMRGAPRAQAVATPPVAAVQDPLDSIARCEDLRTDGEGLLQVLAARGEPRTRARAVRALGRLPLADYGASVSDSLVEALEDEDPGVRATAAFALGMRGDPSTVGALALVIDAASDENSNAVRARCVEALSRIDDPRARRAVIEALFAPGTSADPERAIARMATLGILRFPKTAPESAAAETELVRFTASLRTGLADEELQWRALSTLARRAVVGARAEFERGASSTDPRSRLFAMQGLGAIPPDARSLRLLHERLPDFDWRVACEAAFALGKQADQSSIRLLLDASKRSEPALSAHHVRRAAFDALGRIPAAKDSARGGLSVGLTDPSAAVRAAAIEACARLFASGFATELVAFARDSDAVVRAGAAAALAHMPIDMALELAESLVRDPDLRVATTAVDALAVHAADPRVRAKLRTWLAANDNGVRLSAATALKEKATAEDLPALERALASTRGEIAPEVAAAIVDAAVTIGDEAALALLRVAATNVDPFVARKARAAALAIRPSADLPPAHVPSKRSSVLPPAYSGANPRVAFETTRGTLVFELFPDEAPFHVANLLELARRGHYDGTRIHRVVADFVVQGGDRRGDGNGGTTWRGDSLRGEFGPRPYRRGSLGMPRNDDPDSGGSQIFVTHRETPHLDGRYTLFGDLIEGFDVLDALQVGDEIRTVRELSSGS